MKVRPAASADLPAVAGVFLACWRDAYPGVLARDVLDGMDEEAADDLWRVALSSSGAHTEVAEKGESVVGVIRFGRDPDGGRRGHVFSLYVHPSASGSGIGGALLERAEAWFRSQGLPEATLWVFEANAAARRFYARHGWFPDGETRIESQFRAPEVRLRLPLGTARGSPSPS